MSNLVSTANSYANIADELSDAGYSATEIDRIKEQLDQSVKLRDTIKNAARETLDLKTYEADMRHLIDTYIEADEPRKISPFDNVGLLDLIIKTGINEAIVQRLGGLKGNKEAIAETIENNVRSKIVKEQMNDPTFYETMSDLLDEVIADRKAKAIAYEEYLKRIGEIVQKIDAGVAEDTPKSLDTPGKRAIYNALKQAMDGSDRGHDKCVHNKAADKLARISAKRPFHDPIEHENVGRKTSDKTTVVGSVEMNGQRMTILIVGSKWLSAQKTWKYRYQVMSKKSPYRGCIDFIYFDGQLSRHQKYYIRVNDDGKYPQIEKVFRKVA